MVCITSKHEIFYHPKLVRFFFFVLNLLEGSIAGMGAIFARISSNNKQISTQQEWKQQLLTQKRVTKNEHHDVTATHRNQYDSQLSMGQWWRLSRRSRDSRHHTRQSSQEVFTEGLGVWDAVDIRTLRAEIGIGDVVEDHKTGQEQEDNDRKSYQNQTELGDSVPLAQRDIRHENK